MNQIAFELDYLPVGDESKSGDAIAFRFGNYENGNWMNQQVFIIDGGNASSGEALINLVTKIYKSDTIDRVILTHPDVDHASGIRNVLNELKVGKIWMHRPWHYWSDLKNSIHDGRITKKTFNDRLREAYQFAHDIEQIAINKKIKIFPPHQGSMYEKGIITNLGPSKELYLELIRGSEKTPLMKENANLT